MGCVKKMTREKSKFKKEKKPETPPEDPEDSITPLLHVIHAEIKVMKVDLKDNNMKINELNTKINDIECKSAKSEQDNLCQFGAIRHNMANLETTVTTKVVNVIDPKIT